MINMSRTDNTVLFLAVAFCGVVHVLAFHGAYDVRTPRFCQVRPGSQCCKGRDDKCTMPIYDSVCYCDEFCNRTVSDCCPDFWGFCMGIAPPRGALTIPKQKGPAYQHGPQKLKNNCVHYGKVHYPGAKIQANCNNCTCVKEMIHEKEYNWKCTQKICTIRPELMVKINGGHYGWTASNYSFLWGTELSAAVTYRLGTIHPERFVMGMTPIRMKKMHRRLPESFDARHKWKGLIQGVRDQGNCASSWAFSTTDVASDRISIQSHGKIMMPLSPQHLISCNTYHQKACHGGHLDRAWWYIRKSGVVTDECYPYRSGESMKKEHCHIYPYTPVYRMQCPRHQRVKSDIYKTSPPYRISKNTKEIMKEIMDNGPVQATLKVKDDFFMYKSGVYQYSMPAKKHPQGHHHSGYHSVKIIGWGVDKSQNKETKYWLCANSWGSQWGENGYFKIVRGQNECDIESFIVGVWGRVTSKMMNGSYKRQTHSHNEVY